MGHYLKTNDLLLQIYTNNILEQVVSVNLNHKNIRNCYQTDDRYSVKIKADQGTGFR